MVQVIEVEPDGINGDALNDLVDALSLLEQLLNLEVLHIAASEHLHKLALPTTSLALEVIESLHTANQPRSLSSRHTAVRNNLSMHKDQSLIIRQIQVVRNSSMRLSIRAMHLERAEVREDHCRSVGVGSLALGLSRLLRRRVESPL
jgi:hypothetical protein